MKCFLVSLAFLSLTCSAAFTADKPLNVLFIAVDDMNCDLGCYGNPQVKSPNIDRLAKMGVRFERAYCQFPLCSPSRSSLMTGLRPDTTQVYDLQKRFRTVIPDVVTIPQMFMNNGYYAARVGKIYHYGNPGDIGTSGLDDPPSWNHFVNPAGRDKTVLENDIINYTPKRGLGSAMSFLADKQGKDEEHTDGKVAIEGVKLIEEHSRAERDSLPKAARRAGAEAPGNGKPFFLAIGFYKPHTPYVAPAKYFENYPMNTIKLPEEPAGNRDTKPKAALQSTPQPLFGVTVDQARECKQAYYAAISFVDAQIGKVLDAMDRNKLWDSTVVVFWSDHGYHLGQHGLWMKQSLFEESARVPMIIVAPGAKGNGKMSPRTVEFVDLYPTLADLSGLKPPANLQGKSLRPLLDDPQAKWDKPAFTQVWRGSFAGHSVRTERWRYTEWNGGKDGVELYDQDSDPKEFTNLAGDPKHSATLAELKAMIDRNWANEYKPSGEGKGGKGKGKKAKGE
jgi:uncharacterized sulfatase